MPAAGPAVERRAKKITALRTTATVLGALPSRGMLASATRPPPPGPPSYASITGEGVGLETLVEVTPFDGINPRDGNDTPALVSARSRSDGESSFRLSAAAAART